MSSRCDDGWHVRCSGRKPPVPERGHTAAAADVIVALSLLRLGSDTRAMRLFSEHLLPELSPGVALPLSSLDRLADLLGLSGADRTSRIDKARASAAKALERATAIGAELVSIVDPRYPPALRQIVDPPLALWTLGSPDILDAPAVAVVGSRNATPSGREVARRFGNGLTAAGLVVVSGMARGIDAAAHRGALAAGGHTIAVLGNGVDVVYPPEHAALADEIRSAGAVVSEFPPGTRPFASHFPLRNRIISGSVRAVVVIEASERSGSLITARMALEQGRDVLAVPGNILSGCYRGCHALIKDGARLVETVDEILDEVGWTSRPIQSVDPANCLTDSGLLLTMVAGLSVTADELALGSGRTVADCLAELGALEVAGRVARVPGGGFVRLDGPATNRQR